MILSPIWLQMSGGATTSAIITGAIIVVFSAIQYFWENSLPSWITGAAAVWAFISVFILTMSGGAALSMILSAVAVFLISLWDGAEVDAIEQHRLTSR